MSTDPIKATNAVVCQSEDGFRALLFTHESPVRPGETVHTLFVMNISGREAAKVCADMGISSSEMWTPATDENVRSFFEDPFFDE